MRCVLTGQVKNLNSITIPGGGSAEVGESLGLGPYTIEFDEEDNESFTASMVGYDNKTSGMKATNVQTAIDELFTDVSEGKTLIATAVTDKGVETAATDSFPTMAEKISQITTKTPIETVNITVKGLTGISNCSLVMPYEEMLMPITIRPNNNYQIVKNTILTFDSGSIFPPTVTPQSAYENIGLIVINSNLSVMGYKIIDSATIEAGTGTGGN